MRISTRFTILSVTITSLAAVSALIAILVSEFSGLQSILMSRVDARIARGGDWALGIHFMDKSRLTRELDALLLAEPLLAGASVVEPSGERNHRRGQAYRELPTIRSDAESPTEIITRTVRHKSANRSSVISGLDIPYIYVISVPVMSPVNPLDSIENAERYRVAAARASGGAQFVVGYIETYTPAEILLKDLLPRANALILVSLTLVIVAFLFVRSTVRRISKPMEELATAADDISSGKLPKVLRIAGHQKDEIGDIANVLNGVIEGVHKMTAQLNVDRELMSLQVNSTKKKLSVAEAKVSQTRDSLRRVAYYDAVTSLPNRRLMLEQLEVLLRIAMREKHHLGVLVIDVENLRRINESLGHEAGDSALRQIAHRLTECLRSSDVVSIDDHPGDPSDISRIGNNEFCVLLHGISQMTDAARTAQRVNDHLTAPMELAGTMVAPVITLGVAVAPDHASQGNELLRAADIALTAARQRAAKGPLLFSRELDDAGSERFRLEADLRKADYDREFSLHYQAQIDCSTGTINGAEALLRWEHPTLGSIPPFKFIPIAEETGLIVDIGRWVIERACADFQQFRDAAIAIGKISVNVSAAQLNEALAPTVSAALNRHGIPPDQLQLELTESLLVHDVDTVLNRLHELRDGIGVRLSIDDFGTGYSSLAYLAQFPLNELKIDRSFVLSMEADESSAKVTSAIIAMAKQLELDVVVEGVDNPLQLHRLKSFGAQIIQGFLFSRPQPREEFINFVRTKAWRETLETLD